MRPILLGPFGSMGIMNMKLRVVCIEDMFLESWLFLFALFRIATANTNYEKYGAYGSLIVSTCISLTTSILVLDGGIQCFCCRSKPLCTSLRCFGHDSFEYISDKALIKLFSIFSRLGILMGFLTIITESITFWDKKESRRPVVDIPDHLEFGNVTYLERDNAIVIIILQIIISIPWRIYTLRITQGVLNAIHCAEVLQFRSAYSGDALRRLLPDTGLSFGVDLANERDVPTLAKLYCESFASLFEHIGLPKDCSPAIIEANWRSKGKLVLSRWLGRVGVVRNELGEVIGALSLQLPGDAAAYESLMFRSYSDTYDVLNPLDSSSMTVISNQNSVEDSTRGSNEEYSESDDSFLSSTIPEEFFKLGIFGALRFRYKHTIICDHVCPPGEAYVDFLCTTEKARRTGVGSRLMLWAEQSSEKLGCGRIALSVWELNKEAQLFYERLGYKLSNQRSDFISRLAIQIIFLFRGRFYDFEKSVGQEQGRAIYASVYGFTSDRVSEMDAASNHGNWTQSAYRLSELVTNQVFVLASRQNSLSQPLPASAATPDTTPSIDSPNTIQKEEFIGSERRHHVQLSSSLSSQSTSPLLNSLNSHNFRTVSGDQLFKEFPENSLIPQPTDTIKNDSITEPISLTSSNSSLNPTSVLNSTSNSLTSPQTSPRITTHRNLQYTQQQQQHQQSESQSENSIDDSNCKVGNVLDNNQTSNI